MKNNAENHASKIKSFLFFFSVESSRIMEKMNFTVEFSLQLTFVPTKKSLHSKSLKRFRLDNCFKHDPGMTKDKRFWLSWSESQQSDKTMFSFSRYFVTQWNQFQAEVRTQSHLNHSRLWSSGFKQKKHQILISGDQNSMFFLVSQKSRLNIIPIRNFKNGYLIVSAEQQQQQLIVVYFIC